MLCGADVETNLILAQFEESVNYKEQNGINGYTVTVEQVKLLIANTVTFGFKIFKSIKSETESGNHYKIFYSGKISKLVDMSKFQKKKYKIFIR